MTTNRERRILILEDDLVLGALMVSMLADAGYTAEAASSPLEVSGSYDLVVADYLEPAYVRGQPWPHLDTLRLLANGGPILGCTGHPEALEEAPAALGVTAVAAKPFDIDEFITIIDRLLAEEPINPTIDEELWPR